jgi:hypothetical protein
MIILRLQEEWNKLDWDQADNMTYSLQKRAKRGFKKNGDYINYQIDYLNLISLCIALRKGIKERNRPLMCQA